MREKLMEIVREVAREAEVPSSLLVSSSRRRDIEKARWRSILEIVKRHPEVTANDMADVFGLNERAGRYRIATARAQLERGGPPRPWQTVPRAIMREHVANLTPGVQQALFTGVRTKEIVAIRWGIAQDIYRRCPGIRPVDIARLLNVDRTSILYAIGKIPDKNARTTSAPVNPEQKRTNAA